MHTVETLIAERLTSPAMADPFTFYERMRTLAPVAVLDGLTIVTDWHNCESLANSPALSSELHSVGRDEYRAMPDEAYSLATMDPPDHTRLRRLVSRAFTPRAVTRHEAAIRARADDLLSAVAHSDTFDVVADFARPLTLTTICDLIGIPEEDRYQVGQWGDTLALLPGSIVTAEADRRNADFAHVRNAWHDYLVDLIARRRSEPPAHGALLDTLCLAAEDGDRLTESELVDLGLFLITAGFETTKSVISTGYQALLHDPAQLRDLRDDPSLASGAVEETLRYDPPLHLTKRVALHDVDLERTRIDKGSLVVLALAAANRDPDVHKDPDAFDIRRADPRHLSFVPGRHFCLGAALARMQSRIALTALAQRVRDPRPVPGGADYAPSIALHGLERFTVAHAGVTAPDTPAPLPHTPSPT